MAAEQEPHLTPQLQEHYEKEAEILMLLVDLEQRYQEFYKLYQCEVEGQKIIIERLWKLTQRYLILISCVPGCRYPEVYTLSAEEAIINEYEEKLETIRHSNNEMKNALMELNNHCKHFYNVYGELNKSLETPFIMGDKHHRSIRYHKIMTVDIFNYLYAAVLKMKCYMHQLDPINLDSVEDYRELLNKDSEREEFKEYLENNYIFCKCLKPAPTCPIEKLKCLHQNIQSLRYVSRV
ncbi:CG31910 [Drosophila busckii]|uniref:CG31910 n=1 Tax=Drosophila busckii TaxID=30019 RepID=A0A0M4EAV8_DROBS|nr:uncharacterized protein LOC108594509 [Drosophila busckii]ALC38435.1 CG31910 [Drosophila busckii]